MSRPPEWRTETSSPPQLRYGATPRPTHAIGDSLIGFIEQSSKFLKPVFAGDTLYPTLTISALLPQKTTGVVVMEATLHNQRAELVMTGEHKYLLRL